MFSVLLFLTLAGLGAWTVNVVGQDLEALGFVGIYPTLLIPVYVLFLIGLICLLGPQNLN